jgi:hypothetical protein
MQNAVVEEIAKNNPTALLKPFHGLVDGRIVKYRLKPEDVDPMFRMSLEEGREVAAMVVRVVNKESGVINLTIFPDWQRDGFVSRHSANPQPVGIASKENVEYSKEPIPGCWRWPSKE